MTSCHSDQDDEKGGGSLVVGVERDCTVCPWSKRFHRYDSRVRSRTRFVLSDKQQSSVYL